MDDKWTVLFEEEEFTVDLTLKDGDEFATEIVVHCALDQPTEWFEGTKSATVIAPDGSVRVVILGLQLDYECLEVFEKEAANA